MNTNLKTFLIVIASIIIGGGAFMYGALTAPKSPQKETNSTIRHSQAVAPTPTPSASKEPTTEEKLTSERDTIDGVLIEKYPLIATSYVINKGELYEEGKWYGTTLTYKGADLDNRDTLRVLLEKKNGVWILLTTPPRPLLSVKEFPDVPKSVLQAINKPVSLPAGAANSPQINPAL